MLIDNVRYQTLLVSNVLSGNIVLWFTNRSHRFPFYEMGSNIRKMRSWFTDINPVLLVTIFVSTGKVICDFLTAFGHFINSNFVQLSLCRLIVKRRAAEQQEASNLKIPHHLEDICLGLISCLTALIFERWTRDAALLIVIWHAIILL